MSLSIGRPCGAAARPALVAAATAWLSSAAVAQSSPQFMFAAEPVVVTATRMATPLAEVLADVTVIGRADIERRAAASVAELLRGVAGFEMARNGGPGGTTSVFVRGAESRFTAVLIDGVRVDSQSTGGAPWEALPLAQIERIEIVRGPAGAVYGSDALAGVVQIFTRRGRPGVQADVGLGAGNLGTARTDASVRGADGPLDWALSASAERSDGFNAITNPANASYSPDRDGYRSRGLDGRVGLALHADHRLELSALSQRMRSRYDAYHGRAPAADDRALNDLDTLRAAWSAQWTPAWRSELSLGDGTTRYETRPSPYVSDTRVRNWAWQHRVALGQQRFDATLERREDRLVNSSIAGGRGERHQDAVALGHAWQGDVASLQLNLRHDRDSEFGTNNTGAVAAGWRLSPGWRLLGSAGTAFRAPTLYQRYSQYGNAALRPEESHNLELGLHREAADWRWSATAWRNRVSNLISYSAPGVCTSSAGCYRNTSRARLQGVTLEAAATLGAVRVSGSADLQSPRDEGNGTWLARRARQVARLRADTDAAGWTLGAQLLASAARYNEAANTNRLGGYALLGLDAQRALSPGWNLVVRVDNALDRAVVTAKDYADAPRQLFVALRWTPLP